ncbi:MAG TPA: FecR domain-containing protein [Pedobacter sp.]
MKVERFKYLYQQYLSGLLSGSEQEEWMELLKDKTIQEELELTIPWFDIAPEKLTGLSEERSESIISEIILQPQRRSKKVKTLWPRIVAAAIALIITGVYFFNYNGGTESKDIPGADHIAPGTIGATLTLSNGRQIKLSDAVNGEIAREAGVSVKKTADGQLVYEMKESNSNPDQINKLSTAKGETYILTLPDKSKVWLNAASSLTYTAGLNEHGLRRVSLVGEAYFEVAKDKAHPFIVESRGQEVEVLGTHFNINAYNDESVIATTLLEGSVKVTAGVNQQILRPGQQAINDNSKIKVGDANIESVTDWKNGDFFLNHVNFKTAMRKIARWYDVEIVYDPSVPDDIESGGWISRSSKLSSVLKLIASSGQVNFSVEGNRIYVTK